MVRIDLDIFKSANIDGSPSADATDFDAYMCDASEQWRTEFANPVCGTELVTRQISPEFDCSKPSSNRCQGSETWFLNSTFNAYIRFVYTCDERMRG